MSKVVRVVHTGGGSLTYRYQGKPHTLRQAGDRGSMSEDLYNQHRDKLILESDEAFLKISPDYKGQPKSFDQPRPVNPIARRPLSKLAERAVELVEQDQAQIDDGLEALRAKLAECESQWIGKSTPEEYLKRYGKDNKKSNLAAEIIRLKGLIAEVEVG